MKSDSLLSSCFTFIIDDKHIATHIICFQLFFSANHLGNATNLGLLRIKHHFGTFNLITIIVKSPSQRCSQLRFPNYNVQIPEQIKHVITVKVVRRGPATLDLRVWRIRQQSVIDNCFHPDLGKVYSSNATKWPQFCGGRTLVVVV